MVGAYALSEAGSGSDAFALKCQAVADGDDWILNGRKLWITNGAEAGLYIVFATVDPDAGYRGITAFLVEREADGFAVGKKEDKLGIRASSTTELILDDVRVPGSDVLGEVGKGYKVAIETLNEGRIGIGAQMVGLAQGALDRSLQYVQERQQFGQTIGDFQAVRFQLAEMATEVEAARLLVYNAARLKDAGKSFVMSSAMAKLFSADVAQRVSSACIDLFGGYGFTKDYPVEKYFPGCQDRIDLRRHVEHAEAYHRQAVARRMSSFTWIQRLLFERRPYVTHDPKGGFPTCLSD